MLRIGLFSEDRALQPLLSSALGKGFQVTLSADEAALQHSIETGTADVILVDLDDNQKSVSKRSSVVPGSWRVIRPH